MAYKAGWDSTDQVAKRAVNEGIISRFGTLDPSDGGDSQRYSISGEWHHATPNGMARVLAYGFYYDLDLFSNFTYFLDDPKNGDQFEQKDDRVIMGAGVSQRFLSRWFGRDTESVVGVQGRLDEIPTIGLYHTRATQRLATIRQDGVRQTSGAVYFQTSIQWSDTLRTVAGLRGDVYAFAVASSDPATSKPASRTLTKLS